MVKRYVREPASTATRSLRVTDACPRRSCRGADVSPERRQAAGDLGAADFDAVHLAAALTFQSTAGLRVPFVTADARQRDAAEPSGLPVFWAG